MTTHTAQEQQAGVEDILLVLLGLASGPLLWWMGQTWKSQPMASSLHTLEYWIALLCGLVGAGLAALWLIFLVAGMAFVIGIKTRQTALTYWSELFTPKFLRRVLISVLGAQLVFSSQAVASLEVDEISAPSQSASEPEAFMPYVEPPTESNQADVPNQVASQSPSPLPEPTEPSSTSSGAAPDDTSTPTLSPTPRETSQVVLSPETPPTPIDQAKPTPAPRQTSTIPVASETVRQEVSDIRTKSHRSNEFTPQPLPISPHVSAPPHHDEAAQTTFVVKAGDCLWDIAHYELGADATLFHIDRRWRQWWEHNFNLLGDDPHTLQPGTILEIPPFTD